MGMDAVWCLLTMGLLLVVLSYVLGRALLYPAWLRNTTPEQGLTKEIVGNAKKYYGPHVTNPMHDFQLPYTYAASHPLCS
jgi:hypothetical protein